MSMAKAVSGHSTVGTALWLHNKLGTSNDSWISGSICSQLNKEVLRNIKECFPDLQTQVKLKLLLSLFHIPQRLMEEWKRELEEVIEVAGLDSELWVSMLAETMKTFPATSSLNTEISDYEETRPIFTDMVNDLRKMVGKHSNLGMLPLECQYLNKNALISVVGQQANPVKHFTLKRKPKSATLRTELLHKSADAQSSLKKTSAPTIPLRSRGMPRKMTDTTPLKGIPSRVPTTGFRSPNISINQQRPNLSRTPAGRKDGGIKLIEFTDQPLGYAAAKKRKREQQLEEQQKKQELKQAAAAARAASPTSPTPALNTSTASVPDTPTTPTSANASLEIKSETNANLSQSTSIEENVELHEVIAEPDAQAKTDTTAPEYASTLVTYTQPSSTAAATPTTPTTPTTTKPTTKVSVNSVSSTLPLLSKAAAAMSTTKNAQTPTSGAKRIKQEIEIKSEEVLVPASIKLEKVDNQSITIQQPNAQPKRIIIQQSQPQQQQQTHVLIRSSQGQQKIGNVTLTSTQARQNTVASTTPLKMEKLDIKPLVRSNATTNNTSATIISSQQIRQSTNPLANLPNNISVKITSTKAKQAQQQQQQAQQQQQQPILINSSTPVILSTSPSPGVRQVKQPTVNTTPNASPQAMKSINQLKSSANSGPVIISQTIIQHAKRNVNNTLSSSSTSGNVITQPQQQIQQNVQQQAAPTQYIITSSPQQQQAQQQQQSLQQVQQQPQQLPTLTTFATARAAQQQQQPGTTTLYQTTGGNAQQPTKILLKTSPTSGTVMMTPLRQQQTNPPPLIATTATQQPTVLSIQNVQLPNRPVTIQPASQAAQQQHLQAQLQHHQQQAPQHTIVANTTATQQPKLTQVVMQSNPIANTAGGVKNKTIILTQKGMLLRSLGNDMYEQIPISNVSGLQTLGTTLMTTAAGPPGLVKTTPSTTVVQPTQTIQIQQQQPGTLQQQLQSAGKQLPTLITTNTISPQTTHMIVQQQPTQTNLLGNATQQTIIRPVMQGGLTTLPQGLTLIQRPGQQPQLVQVQTATAGSQPQLQRTIITQSAPQSQQPQQQQLRTQQIVLQHKPATQPRIITTTNASGQTQQIQIQQNPNVQRTTQIVQVQQTQQQTQQQQQQPQRKGLSLSNEHVHKAHEMFRKANRVSRPDKALILGFMAGMRENPRPNSENAIVIKLGETEEKVQQEDGSTALCLAESLIRLDYNTGEWKTFQNYRRVDQSGGSVVAQSSVVI